MQTQISVKCTDQQLKLTANPTIASGGVNENVITFEFCSMWNDFKKVAVFWLEEWLDDAEKKPLPIALDENNSCVVPWEVTADAGVFFFGVLGVLGEVERTSNVLEYDVSQGVIRGEYAMPATKDLFAQLVEASHTHDNKDTLDKLLIKNYKNGGDTLHIGDKTVWSDAHGGLIEKVEIDETTGDITLFCRTVPLLNIPSEKIVIKQTFPEINQAIADIRGGIDEIEAMIDESGVLDE